MLIGIVENNTVVTIGDYRELFKNTSFTSNGPSNQWLLENNCKKVNTFKSYDQETQKLVPSSPYIEGDWIYTVQIENKTQEELDQYNIEKQQSLIKSFEDALDNHLDQTAKLKRYNDRFSCAVRAGFAGPYQQEGIAFATWMDTCNSLAYSILADVLAGNRQPPESVEAFLAELPTMVWPE